MQKEQSRLFVFAYTKIRNINTHIDEFLSILHSTFQLSMKWISDIFAECQMNQYGFMENVIKEENTIA